MGKKEHEMDLNFPEPNLDVINSALIRSVTFSHVTQGLLSSVLGHKEWLS